MEKELQWKQKRLGMITASELGSITSASGKIIDGTLSYIRSKRFERKHGYTLPVTARTMEIGNEQEPYIYQWAVANLGLPGLIYAKDQPEIPFWVAKDCPIGASPDSFTPDKRIVVEFKCLVGNTAIEFFDDEYTDYFEKKKAVWSDHGDQILGQFISEDAVEEIWLVKYIYQNDDIIEDNDDPNEPWRGIVFKFARKDYEESIKAMKARATLIDAMIDSKINPSDFKVGDWSVDNGELKQTIVEKPEKPKKK